MTSSFLREPNLGRQLFGGYSIEETDALLQRAASTVDKMRKTVTALRQEAMQGGEATPPVGAQTPLRLAEGATPAPGITPPGAASTQAAYTVGELMVTAHQAIDLLKEKAEREAHEIIEAAHSEASAIVTEAAKERARLEEQQAATTTIVERAQRQAASIIAQANREREQILADTDHLKSAAEQLRNTWINQFSQMIDQLSGPAPAAPDNGESPAIDRELIERLQGEPQAEAHEEEQAPEH
jgi:cell division septum initiation protein DivIVA